jgi:predicted DsbA family dithiol-disulfide isomerase
MTTCRGGTRVALGKGSTVEVEIWSDIVCPWCYVGKRRFEAALAAFEHRDDVRVTWRSFELDPSAPRERESDGASHIAQKYGIPREQAVEMQQNLAAVAAGDGLELDFAHTRSGNTFDAHRLVHLAAEHGLQDAAKERLMRAYFSEGEPIGDVDVLARLAVEVGLAPEEVRDVLDSDRYAEQVRDDEQTASSLGISAVPFFVVDRALGASGAQPSDVLTDFLQHGWEAGASLPVVAQGDSCGVDSC